LDGEKYGKMSVLQYVEGESYSEGIVLNASEIGGMNQKQTKCGLKEEKITDKCPTCKSPYMLQ
jgi:hypothetical protein